MYAISVMLKRLYQCVAYYEWATCQPSKIVGQKAPIFGAIFILRKPALFHAGRRFLADTDFTIVFPCSAKSGPVTFVQACR